MPVLYADVVLPLPLAGTFTYHVPQALVSSVREGCRVIVPFGVRKFYAAVVVRVHGDEPPEDIVIKDVHECLDERPVLLDWQIRFWQWMAGYYLCTLGEVCKAALPSGLKLESESVVECSDDFVADVSVLTAREQRVYTLLEDGKPMKVNKLQKAVGTEFSVLPVVRALLDKGAVRMKETLEPGFRPRTEVCVRLCREFFDNGLLVGLYDSLKRASRQLALLSRYVEMSGLPAALTLQNYSLIKEVPRSDLLADVDAKPAALSELVRRGVFELYTREVDRIGRCAPLWGEAVSSLSAAQQAAYDGIRNVFAQRNVCLLHGVTSSGKTEVYTHLIRHELEAGRQVLYLLPEIALTTQITERLRRVFGARMGVYHSKYPDAERVEVWKKQLSSEPFGLILGVRSALFLPFTRLGLVIVDEEHETSYKQQDPAPRYHARDAAIMLASLCGARTLLGTATPSVESYFNARSGKYGLVELTTRYGDVFLPEIRVVDVAELRRKKLMKSFFSPLLTDLMREALSRKEQVILFQNRRGYAPFLECRACGWVPRCTHCDVSLTYHHAEHRLVCHYCGASYVVPVQCPACGHTELRDCGYGTEKVEDAVQACFPGVRTARMDMDTTRSRRSYEQIIRDFQQGRTDVLVGTQMVSKGLDFDRVRVVGILDADGLLNVPDFRSHERSFQLMSQVAGRAGRRNSRGLVVLQTRQPELPVIGQVVRNDYAAFFAAQLAERELFRFPPFCRLIYIYLKHKQDRVVAEAAEVLAGCLRAAFGGRLLGPAAPAVARMQSLFIRKLVLKLENGLSVHKVRRVLADAQQRVQADARFRSVIVYYDVDPL